MSGSANFGSGFSSAFGAVHSAMGRNIESEAQDQINRLNRPFVEDTVAETARDRRARGVEDEPSYARRLFDFLGITERGTGGSGARDGTGSGDTTATGAVGGVAVSNRSPAQSRPEAPPLPDGTVPAPSYRQGSPSPRGDASPRTPAEPTGTYTAPAAPTAPPAAASPSAPGEPVMPPLQAAPAAGPATPSAPSATYTMPAAPGAPPAAAAPTVAPPYGPAPAPAGPADPALRGAPAPMPVPPGAVAGGMPAPPGDSMPAPPPEGQRPPGYPPGPMPTPEEARVPEADRVRNMGRPHTVTAPGRGRGAVGGARGAPAPGAPAPGAPATAPTQQDGAPAAPGAQPSPTFARIQRGADDASGLNRMIAEREGIPPDQVRGIHLRRTQDIIDRHLSAPMAQAASRAMRERRAEALAMGSARAMAAWQSGDMVGMTRALNALNVFADDGFDDRFVPTATGVQLTRTPEGGGEPQVINLTREQLRPMILAGLDPKWWETHLHAERTLAETTRAHMASEANQRAATGVQAASVGVQRARLDRDLANDQRTHRQQDDDRAATERARAARTALDGDRDNPQLQQAYHDALIAVPQSAYVQLTNIDDRQATTESQNETRRVQRDQIEANTALQRTQRELIEARTAAQRLENSGDAEAQRVARERLRIAERNAATAEERARALRTRAERGTPTTPIPATEQTQLAEDIRTRFAPPANGQPGVDPSIERRMQILGARLHQDNRPTGATTRSTAEYLWDLLEIGRNDPEQLAQIVIRGGSGGMVISPLIAAELMQSVEQARALRNAPPRPDVPTPATGGAVQRLGEQLGGQVRAMTANPPETPAEERVVQLRTQLRDHNARAPSVTQRRTDPAAFQAYEARRRELEAALEAAKNALPPVEAPTRALTRPAGR